MSVLYKKNTLMEPILYIHASEWMQLKDAKSVISTRILLQEDYMYLVNEKSRQLNGEWKKNIKALYVFP